MALPIKPNSYPRPQPPKVAAPRLGWEDRKSSIFKSIFSQRPKPMGDPLVSEKKPTPAKPAPKTGASNIFGGREEISRAELRQKLRGDGSIFEAEKSVGLHLDSTERAKLEKQVFPQGMGQNISKKDLKQGISKLGQQKIYSKDPAQKEKLDKEMKFFKKIGGL